MADAVEVIDPDAVDEDPEQCMGEELPDPWNDPEETEWPQADNEDEEED